MTKLRVAMIAPPWLTVPAKGYGGTEAVIHNLCRGLRAAGVEVELFGVKGSGAPVKRYHWSYQDEQYPHIAKPYDAPAIPLKHVLTSIEEIRRRRSRFDVIHDHNNLIGPALLRDRPDLPPVLHTLHNPFSSPEWVRRGHVDTTPLYMELAGSKRLYFVAISHAQLAEAPLSLRPRVAAVIHHGIDPAEHPVTVQKDDYFVNVGRIAPEKGISVAAQLCRDLDERLVIGGVVAGVGDPDALTRALQEPGELLNEPEFIYYRDHVAALLEPGRVEFVGRVTGAAKDKLIGRAKAFLMPIEWSEPFGVAVIDALVCGTPVVAMRRGSMPEIIEHGVNGFLADSPEEFASYMRRVGEIDPMACRRSVEERFSYRVMADQYAAVYRQLVGRHRGSVSELLPRPLVPQKNFAFYEQLPGIRAKSQPDPLEE